MMEKNAAEKIMDDQDMSRIVRQMDESDIDRIMEIEKRSFVAPWSRTMFEETIFSPTSRGLVIERNNSIVGYTVFYTVDVEAHVMNLAVNPMEKTGLCPSVNDQRPDIFCGKRYLRMLFGGERT
jgi:hypothetical protein